MFSVMLSVMVSVSTNFSTTCDSVDHNSEIDTLKVHLYEWVLPSARPVDEIYSLCPMVILNSESIMNPRYGISPVYKVSKQRT